MYCLKLSLSLTSFLLLCLSVCCLPGSTARCTSELSCQSQTSGNEPSSDQFIKREALRGLTNAERLRRGLPLLPPTLRNDLVFPRAPPRASPVPTVTYRGRIRVSNRDNGNFLGFVAVDPNYWTPRLVRTAREALLVQFSLSIGATSGSQLQLEQLNEAVQGPIFGLVVGRDSTNSNITPGSFNYLYFGSVSSPGTPAGSTPQRVRNYFSFSAGLDKAAETSIWSVDIFGSMVVQWINTDGTSRETQIFLQDNHLYAGGDYNAFHHKFPAPVTPVELAFALDSSR